MEIYILLVISIIILGMFLSKKQKKIYCIIIGMLLLVLSGCRNPSMGIIDTEYIYIPTYYKIRNIPFESINDEFSKDILFHYMTKLFVMISDNSQLWLAFVSMPFIVGTVWLTYKESDNAILSLLLLLALNFYRYELYSFKTLYCFRNYYFFIQIS